MDQPHAEIAEQHRQDRDRQRALPLAGMDSAPQPERDDHQRRDQQYRGQAEEGQQQVRAPRPDRTQYVAEDRRGGGVERRVGRAVGDERERYQHREGEHRKRTQHRARTLADMPHLAAPVSAVRDACRHYPNPL